MKTLIMLACSFLAVALALFPPIAVAKANPHYGPIMCTACHVDEEDYELVEEDLDLLCNRCHGEGPLVGNHHPLRKVPEEIGVPEDWPTQDGALTCLTCHLPSHDEYVGAYMFLRSESKEKSLEFCLNCHARKSWEGRDPHKEVNEGKGCGFCHDARPKLGVDTLATVTFCSEPSVLCLRCHDVLPHPAGFDHTQTLSEAQAGQLSNISLYQGKTIVCSTCHNPHVGQSQEFKLRDFALEFRACPGCHQF